MDNHRDLSVAAQRARIALAALAALTRQKHVAVQPRLFDPGEEGNGRAAARR